MKEGPLGYLGMMEVDFPNFFMILGPNGPFTNLPPALRRKSNGSLTRFARWKKRGFEMWSQPWKRAMLGFAPVVKSPT